DFWNNNNKNIKLMEEKKIQFYDINKLSVDIFKTYGSYPKKMNTASGLLWRVLAETQLALGRPLFPFTKHNKEHKKIKVTCNKAGVEHFLVEVFESFGADVTDIKNVKNFENFDVVILPIQTSKLNVYKMTDQMFASMKPGAVLTDTYY
ncbi:hypothetical protein MHBO_004796, partial [Bonamia ostreae]